MELGDQLGLDPAELGEQEFPEQRVVTEPLPPAVEGDEKNARGFQVPKVLAGAGFTEQRIGERRAQLVEDRGAAEKSLGALRQQRQRLAVEVVGDVPIVTGDRRFVTVSVAGDHRGEVEPHRPTFRAGRHRGGCLGADLEVGLREDVRGAGGVEGQVARHELQRVTRCSQPGQVRLL